MQLHIAVLIDRRIMQPGKRKINTNKVAHKWLFSPDNNQNSTLIPIEFFKIPYKFRMNARSDSFKFRG